MPWEGKYYNRSPIGLLGPASCISLGKEEPGAHSCTSKPLPDRNLQNAEYFSSKSGQTYVGERQYCECRGQHGEAGQLRQCRAGGPDILRHNPTTPVPIIYSSLHSKLNVENYWHFYRRSNKNSDTYKYTINVLKISLLTEQDLQF